MFLQQLSISSVVPCEENGTELYIANSIEVRSDEICVESYLGTEDAVVGMKAVNGDIHSVMTEQQDTNTVAGSNDICYETQSGRHHDCSIKQKSYCATPTHRAQSFHYNLRSASRRLDAEADEQAYPVQKNVSLPFAVNNKSHGIPVMQNDVMNLPFQV